MQCFNAPTEAAMLQLGEGWAGRIKGGVVFLRGELGAGKTTLARGILRGLGHRGVVASPTYTLIEHYPLPAGDAYHIDLFRLARPDELAMTGLRDVLDAPATLLVEWPERGDGRLPPPDFTVTIDGDADRRLQVTAADGAALPG